jgi:hypothetical protein
MRWIGDGLDLLSFTAGDRKDVCHRRIREARRERIPIGLLKTAVLLCSLWIELVETVVGGISPKSRGFQTGDAIAQGIAVD